MAARMDLEDPDLFKVKYIIYKCIDTQLPLLMDNLWEEITKKYTGLKHSYPIEATAADLWSYYKVDHDYLIAALGNLDHCLTVFRNGSDIRDDKELIDRIYNTIVHFLLKILRSECISPPLYEESYEIAVSCLTTLFNFCVNGSWHVPELRQLNLLNTLERFIPLDADHDIIELKTHALLVSSYLLTEEERKTDLTLDSETIKFLVEQLEDAMDGESEGGYHPDELMSGVNNIASIDLNKPKLVDANVLPLYVRALKFDSEDLQVQGAQGIWALSFNQEAKRCIVEEAGCMTGM